MNRFQELKNNFQSIDEFYILEEIGHGAFSKVHLTLHKITHQIYALKVIDIQYDQEEIEKQVQYEIQIHSELDHENVVQIHGFFRHKNKICLVLEYIKDGNLYKFLKHQKVLSVQHIKQIFKQMVQVLKYLHDKKIIYRDLKPENILINKENFQVKLCDFGWAIKIYDQKQGCSKAGTYAYMAPESLKVEKQTYASDIWSLGVLLYELFFNKEPFEDESLFNHLLKMKNQEIDFSSRSLPNYAEDLIRSLLFYEQNERLSLNQILKHQFLKPQSHLRQIASQQSLQIKNTHQFHDKEVVKKEKSSLFNSSSLKDIQKKSLKKSVNKQQKILHPRKISISNKNRSLQRRPLRLQNQLHVKTSLRNAFTQKNLLSKKNAQIQQQKFRPKKNRQQLQQNQRQKFFQQNLRKNSMDKKQNSKNKVQFFTLERNVLKIQSTETEFNSTAFETYDNIKKQRTKQKNTPTSIQELPRKKSLRRVLKLKPKDQHEKQKILKMKLEVRKEFNQLRKKQKQLKVSTKKFQTLQSSKNLSINLTPKRKTINNKLKYLQKLIKKNS